MTICFCGISSILELAEANVQNGAGFPPASVQRTLGIRDSPASAVDASRFGAYASILAGELPDLRKTLDRFGTEEACLDQLERTLWPFGVVCPSCRTRQIRLLTRPVTPRTYRCDECALHFRATSETLFDSAHLPLPDWFLAVYIMMAARGRVSAKFLERALGVSYSTAWEIRRRIQKALKKHAWFYAKLLGAADSGSRKRASGKPHR